LVFQVLCFLGATLVTTQVFQRVLLLFFADAIKVLPPLSYGIGSLSVDHHCLLFLLPNRSFRF
jgi:hypothetical protein